MLKLNSAKVKILLIKLAHLIATLAVVFFIIIHFGSDNSQNNNFLPVSDVIKGDETYVSVYENFVKQYDTHRGSFLSPVSQQAKLIYNFEDELSDEIALAAELGSSTEYTSDTDISEIYEQLYEENLPDDIIDENIIIQNEKMKNLNIVPLRKPAYFGKFPVIAVVIDDMGINKKRTAEINSLQYPLTSSFLTYGNDIDKQVAISLAAGHEIMLHAPMEALGKVDNAPDVLTTAMSLQEIKDNFTNMLQKVKGIKGINNHMGSKLTQDKERMTAVMEVLKANDLFFLDSKTSAQSVADDVAGEIGVKHASRNIFLDNNNDKEYILSQLQKTENLAIKNGYAIAIGHPKSQTYAALHDWLLELNSKNIKLVHLSEIINNLNN